MSKTIKIVAAVSGIALGFFISYIVHFHWHFFGATLVTIGNIVGLWLVFPCFIGLFCYCMGWMVSIKLGYEG